MGWYSNSTSNSAVSTSSSYSLRITGTTYRYAFFKRASYTITIAVSPSGYGSVSQTSVTNVPYGTVLSTSGNTLNVNGTTVTATPATSTAQYFYSFRYWTNGDATVTDNITVTANFTMTTRRYYVYAHARYSTSSSGTIASATAGVTGGTVSITFGGSTVTTTDTSSVSKYVPYDSSVTLTAEAKTGYVFVGWYSRPNSTSLVSTSESYSLTVTGKTSLGAFFKRASYTITIAVSPSGYGSVSRTSITADYGTSITTSGSTLTIGSTDITATPASQTAQYTYAFSSWSNASGTVTGAKTITANFTRTTRTYTVTIAVSPSGYGSVSQTSVTNVPYGTVLSQNGNTLNVNGTIVTATPATASAQYTYAFSSWTIEAATETGYVPVTANFTRTTRTYTVTIHKYNAYGSVRPKVIEDVPYGTRIYRGSSITQLYVGETLVTATPYSSTAQYSYSVSSWREDTSSGTTITTGFTLEGDKDIYVRFTRTTRNYEISVYARYSTSSSGTHVSARPGVTGGTASITYVGSTVTTTGESCVSKYLPYGSRVTLTAEAKTGYVFVGWYSSISSTSAFSTSSSYSLSITGITNRFAFFKIATYKVTITRNNTSYGTVSTSSVTDVPYGTLSRYRASVPYGTSISCNGSIMYIYGKYLLLQLHRQQIHNTHIILMGGHHQQVIYIL